MANIKYFSGEIELKGVHYQGTKLVGDPIDFVHVWENGKWTHNWTEVERKIEYKSNPSKHECDARCYNATGRIMKCECSCGGKNHGRGKFICE